MKMLYIFPFLGKFPQYLVLTISKYGLDSSGLSNSTGLHWTPYGISGGQTRPPEPPCHTLTTLRHWKFEWWHNVCPWQPPLLPNHHWQDHQLDVSKCVYHHIHHYIHPLLHYFNVSNCPTVGFMMMTGLRMHLGVVCLFLYIYTVL